MRDSLRYLGALCSEAARFLASCIRPGKRRWRLFLGSGDPLQGALLATREIVPHSGQFWADPFLIKSGDDLFVFFENAAMTTRIGKISVGRIVDGAFTFIGDCLVRDDHLSFPFVFSWGDEILMVPETYQARRLEVWRCTRPPLEWELYATAFEGQSAVDPVIVEHAGRWWLFVTLVSDGFGDYVTEPHVFAIDSPKLESIKPHRRNPVVIDSRCARNAGRIFQRDGKLYRPSQQNPRGTYGFGINVARIETLTIDEYEERIVASMTPSLAPHLHACHHFDQHEDVIVWDGHDGP